MKIQQSNIGENLKRILYKYKKGDFITLRILGAFFCTLAIPQSDPYKVLKYHANGSITTKFEPNVIGRINFKSCHPYKTGQIENLKIGLFIILHIRTIR